MKILLFALLFVLLIASCIPFPEISSSQSRNSSNPTAENSISAPTSLDNSSLFSEAIENVVEIYPINTTEERENTADSYATQWQPPSIEQVKMKDFFQPVPDFVENFKLAYHESEKIEPEIITWNTSNDKFRFCVVGRSSGEILWAQVENSQGNWIWLEQPSIYEIIDNRVQLMTKGIRYMPIPNSEGARIIPGGPNGEFPIVVKFPSAYSDSGSLEPQKAYMLYFDMRFPNSDGSVGTWQFTPAYGLGVFGIVDGEIFRYFEENGQQTIRKISVKASRIETFYNNYAIIFDSSESHIGLIDKSIGTLWVIRSGKLIELDNHGTENRIIDKNMNVPINIFINSEKKWITIAKQNQITRGDNKGIYWSAIYVIDIQTLDRFIPDNFGSIIDSENNVYYWNNKDNDWKKDIIPINNESTITKPQFFAEEPITKDNIDRLNIVTKIEIDQFFINDMDLSPDGEVLGSFISAGRGIGYLLYFNFPSLEIASYKRVNGGSSHSAAGIEFSPDGRYIAEPSDKSITGITIIDRTTGYGIKDIPLLGNADDMVKFSYDSKYLVSTISTQSSIVKNITIYDFEHDQLNTYISYCANSNNVPASIPYALDASPNKEVFSYIATPYDGGPLDYSYIVFSSLKDNRLISKLRIPYFWGGGFKYSFSGNYLAYSPANGIENLPIYLVNLSNNTTMLKLETKSKVVSDISFSPDDKLVAVSAGEELQIWSLSPLKLIKTIPTYCQNMARFSEDGKYLLQQNCRFENKESYGSYIKVWAIKP